jgi:hypothetical protein
MCKHTDLDLFDSIYRKVIGAIGKFEKLGKVASSARKVAGALNKGHNAIKKAENSNRGVKHLGNAVKAAKKINKAVKHAEKARQTISSHKSSHKSSPKSSRSTAKRHHRRELEGDEELSRRDLDAEVFFGREYDDFLAERDLFDDLD